MRSFKQTQLRIENRSGCVSEGGKERGREEGGERNESYISLGSADQIDSPHGRGQFFF